MESPRNSSTRSHKTEILVMIAALVVAAPVVILLLIYKPGATNSPSSKSHTSHVPILPGTTPLALPASPPTSTAASKAASLVGQVRTVILAADMPPAPKMGFPLARHDFGRDRVVKLLEANDFDGLVADCDTINRLFCRAGTKVLVIQVEDYKGEKWAEVRLKSGPHVGNSGWLPAHLLGEWKSPEGFDADKWSPTKRETIHRKYMRAVSESLGDAAKKIGGRSDPEGARALMLRRLAVEKTAIPIFADKLAEELKDDDVSSTEALSIVLFELSRGETVPFNDR